jgi:hypothetical protein
MPSKFPHGAVWWAAVTSAAVMVSPSAATLRQIGAEQALQAGELAEAGPAAPAAAWPGPGGDRPAMGNGHVRTTVAVPSAGAADPGGAW